MTKHDLEETARALVAPGTGILAADESVSTITKRLDALHIPSTAETRRAYREMLFTTPDLARFVSGVIMYDETDPAIEAWGGRGSGVEAGQQALHHRARCNGAASLGEYDESMEQDIADVAAVSRRATWSDD